jgi:hypothetical protein
MDTEERAMNTFVALAIAVPRRIPGPPAEVIASAGSLAALARRVRACAPAARVRVFDRASAALCEGLPVLGTAREPGRAIYLCGPA